MTSVAAKRVLDVKARDGFYFLDGDKYDRVTSVLNVLSKPALYSWHAKTAAANVLRDPEKYSTAEKAASSVYEKVDSAASRGSTVHSIAEALAYGNSPDLDSIPEKYRGYATAVTGFWKATRPEPLAIEINIYSEKHRYAGTTDLIANIAGETWLLDYKTSRGVYPEMGLQLAAYRYADFFLKDQEKFPLPKIDKTAIVSLGENGMFTLTEVDEPYEVFLHALALHRWRQAA